MKKNILLLSLVILLSSFSAVAGSGTNISDAISNQLHLPQHLKSEKLNEKVSVQFKVLPGGNILLVNISTDHPGLKEYIEKEFPKLNVSELKPESTYFIDINFKVL